MVIEDAPRLDFQEISRTGHWSPCSQEFAGAHNLLWALDNGWQLDPEVIRVTYPCRTTQSVSVYRFTLRQNHNTLVMPVIDTPHLLRLIAEHGLQVVPVTAPECLEPVDT
ncbi:MAG TPA: hypothetical protein VKY59_05155 [Spirillospora sp.]|nr:hypothetical protein [Spirillospora sp.]